MEHEVEKPHMWTLDSKELAEGLRVDGGDYWRGCASHSVFVVVAGRGMRVANAKTSGRNATR